MAMEMGTVFDMDRLCHAVEERDAAAQLAMYAPDAEVRIVDHLSQPKAPKVLHNRGEIGAWLEDVCARPMSHAVERAVATDDGGAFTEVCHYPDGTNVMAATVFGLSDGRITSQTVVQAWDEEDAGIVTPA